MQRKPVSSSNIASIGYDAESETLEIQFHNGGIYRYYGVPQAVYTGLMASSSHGSYLAQNIKNRYQYKKVG